MLIFIYFYLKMCHFCSIWKCRERSICSFSAAVKQHLVVNGFRSEWNLRTIYTDVISHILLDVLVLANKKLSKAKSGGAALSWQCVCVAKIATSNECFLIYVCMANSQKKKKRTTTVFTKRDDRCWRVCNWESECNFSKA